MHEESNLNRSICWYWGFIDLCLPLKTVLRKVERGSPKPGDEGVQTTYASINCNAMVKRVWSSEEEATALFRSCAQAADNWLTFLIAFILVGSTKN